VAFCCDLLLQSAPIYKIIYSRGMRANSHKGSPLYTRTYRASHGEIPGDLAKGTG
jgi:hypothetical protein